MFSIAGASFQNGLEFPVDLVLVDLSFHLIHCWSFLFRTKGCSLIPVTLFLVNPSTRVSKAPSRPPGREPHGCGLVDAGCAWSKRAGAHQLGVWLVLCVAFFGGLFMFRDPRNIPQLIQLMALACSRMLVCLKLGPPGPFVFFPTSTKGLNIF